MEKFSDQGKRLSHFENYRIVGCPKCARPIDFFDLKITCVHCGYHKEFKPTDSWFQLIPLTVEIEDYLLISCCGRTLWAMNIEHLDFLESYVKADLRSRVPTINKSLASRLPQWIKSKKNRDEILNCISKLRIKLVDNNYRPR